MNQTTNATIDLANRLARRGFTLASIQIRTPDGRTWEVVPVPAGRGRRPDASWGPAPNAAGGFRLFEIDEEREARDEHDAVDGDTWNAGDLTDYLAAVGGPKEPPRTRTSETAT